ncbi:hypothetical protein VNI00_015942 [Paramarasmius palmivorus]|uniref:Uncharacterized protein n=1 Tax=Paramarasmius palmivorus TaxID=297713 RepID=A0AAW0BHY9_9AGAR
MDLDQPFSLGGQGADSPNTSKCTFSATAISSNEIPRAGQKRRRSTADSLLHVVDGRLKRARVDGPVRDPPSKQVEAEATRARDTRHTSSPPQAAPSTPPASGSAFFTFRQPKATSQSIHHPTVADDAPSVSLPVAPTVMPEYANDSMSIDNTAQYASPNSTPCTPEVLEEPNMYNQPSHQSEHVKVVIDNSAQVDTDIPAVPLSNLPVSPCPPNPDNSCLPIDPRIGETVKNTAEEHDQRPADKSDTNMIDASSAVPPSPADTADNIPSPKTPSRANTAVISVDDAPPDDLEEPLAETFPNAGYDADYDTSDEECERSIRKGSVSVSRSSSSSSRRLPLQPHRIPILDDRGSQYPARRSLTGSLAGSQCSSDSSFYEHEKSELPGHRSSPRSESARSGYQPHVETDMPRSSRASQTRGSHFQKEDSPLQSQFSLSISRGPISHPYAESDEEGARPIDPHFSSQEHSLKRTASERPIFQPCVESEMSWSGEESADEHVPVCHPSPSGIFDHSGSWPRSSTSHRLQPSLGHPSNFQPCVESEMSWSEEEHVPVRHPSPSGILDHSASRPRTSPTHNPVQLSNFRPCVESEMSWSGEESADEHVPVRHPSPSGIFDHSGSWPQSSTSHNLQPSLGHPSNFQPCVESEMSWSEEESEEHIPFRHLSSWGIYGSRLRSSHSLRSSPDQPSILRPCVESDMSWSEGVEYIPAQQSPKAADHSSSRPSNSHDLQSSLVPPILPYESDQESMFDVIRSYPRTPTPNPDHIAMEFIAPSMQQGTASLLSDHPVVVDEEGSRRYPSLYKESPVIEETHVKMDDREDNLRRNPQRSESYLSDLDSVMNYDERYRSQSPPPAAPLDVHMMSDDDQPQRSFPSQLPTKPIRLPLYADDSDEQISEPVDTFYDEGTSANIPQSEMPQSEVASVTMNDTSHHEEDLFWEGESSRSMEAEMLRQMDPKARAKYAILGKLCAELGMSPQPRTPTNTSQLPGQPKASRCPPLRREEVYQSSDDGYKAPDHREDIANVFYCAVRDQMILLTQPNNAPLQTVSVQQRLIWERTMIGGPTIDHFTLELVSLQRWNAWNKEACRVFIEYFKTLEGNEDANDAAIKHVFKNYLRRLQGKMQQQAPLAQHQHQEDAQRVRRLQRQRGIGHRRVRQLEYRVKRSKNHPTLLKILKAKRLMKLEINSGDESDPAKHREYHITSPAWRSGELSDYLRYMSALHLEMKYRGNGKYTPGEFPAPRHASDRPHTLSDVAPSGLPENWYDPVWLNADPARRRALRVKECVPLILPAELVRLAKRFENVKNRKTLPLPPNHPSVINI